MDSAKQLKALFDKQRKLMKTALFVNQKICEVQQKINTLILKKMNATSSTGANEKDLMTEKEVCDWIGKSKATLYRMRTYYNFPHTKIEGQKAIIYSRKAIESYFKENERKGLK
jgi:predicted DNA-binding transcriptional regulator AlpA